MLYLDTHVVVWLYGGLVEHLSERARKEIDTNDILISPMVELELEYLFESKRTTQHADPNVSYLTRTMGLSVCAQSFGDVVAAACEIRWTRDPFDRIIIAQAVIDQSALLTKDESIRDNYANAIW